MGIIILRAALIQCVALTVRTMLITTFTLHLLGKIQTTRTSMRTQSTERSTTYNIND